MTSPIDGDGLADGAIIAWDNIRIAQRMFVAKGWISQRPYVHACEANRIKYEDFVEIETASVHCVIGHLDLMGYENSGVNMAMMMMSRPEWFPDSAMPTAGWFPLWEWMKVTLDDHILSPAWFDESLESVARELADMKGRVTEARKHIAMAKKLMGVFTGDRRIP